MKAPDLKKLAKCGWYHERDVVMSHDMFRSRAFIDLTHTSKYVLMLLLHRREWHYEGKGRKKKRIFHNIGLKFPYSEAAEYGIGETQFSRSIRELVEHGLIQKTAQGGQFHGKRECSEYAIVSDWKLYDGLKIRQVGKGACFSESLQKVNASRTRAKLLKDNSENDKLSSTVIDDSRATVTDDSRRGKQRKPKTVIDDSRIKTTRRLRIVEPCQE